MLSDLSTGDFDFYREYATKMRHCHDAEFMEVIDPDLIRAFYRGKKEKDKRFTRIGQPSEEKHLLLMTTIFSAANTILPNLFYQMINPIITPLKDATAESAALLTALLKHYSKLNEAKRENQEACLNAYFFGLGWKKLGYRVSYMPKPQIEQEPETQIKKPFSFTDMLGFGKKPDSLESKERPEVIESEGLFNASESPLNVMLDHKSDRINRKAILHRLPRTLYELMTFGSYDEKAIDDLYNKHKHIKGSRLNTREIDLELIELHVQQRNGIWILTYVEGFDKPLQYERSTFVGKGFQFEDLAFTSEPGARYPISHMKIAIQVQEKIDKMASMFYEKVARSQDITLINTNDLEKGQLEAIQENRIRGIVVTNKPINSGTFAHVQSPSVQNDLPLLMQMSMQNLIEVMGADQQLVSGKSKNKTLGQDELARVGTKIRESGMQDKVRDFIIAQFRKEAALLQQYSQAELEIEITGEDFSEPIMQEKFKRETVRFMKMENPIAAKRFIEGEYEFDVSVEEAIKPDNENIRAGIEKILITYANLKPMLMDNSKILRTDYLWERWLQTFDFLGNTKKFMQELDSEQLAAMQVKELILNSGGKAIAGNSQDQKSIKNNEIISGKRPQSDEKLNNLVDLEA